MTAVNVSVSHDNDFAVAQTFEVKFLANVGAKRLNHGADFRMPHDFVDAGFFDINDFSLQRQNRLNARIAAAFGGTTGRITFDQEDFGFMDIAALQQFTANTLLCDKMFTTGIYEHQ